MSHVSLKIYAQPALDCAIGLDMAPNSVDDMYDGCKDEMKTMVQKEYLLNEKNTNIKFRQAWEEAEEIYNDQDKTGTALGREHVVSIYVYSKQDFHEEMNSAIRTQQSSYTTTFRYHTINFFLTDALQSLSAQEPETEKCLTGYLTFDMNFSQDVLGKEIRFGSFTSTKLQRYKTNENTENKSCFEIVTCNGADISMFSRSGEAEADVLIPPYEVFNVTQIKRRSEEHSLECEVVYKLDSTRTLSNLNCALFRK